MTNAFYVPELVQQRFAGSTPPPPGARASALADDEESGYACCFAHFFLRFFLLPFFRVLVFSLPLPRDCSIDLVRNDRSRAQSIHHASALVLVDVCVVCALP